MQTHVSIVWFLIPLTNMTKKITVILKEEGFIEDFMICSATKHRSILIALKYSGKKRKPVITTLKRVSKPGIRVYKSAKKNSNSSWKFRNSYSIDITRCDD